jgi:hypothetical protein
MRSLGVHRALDACFELRADRRLAAVLSDAYVDLRDPAESTTDHVVSARRRRGVADDEIVSDLRHQVNDLAAASAVPANAVVRGGAIEIDGIGVAFVGGGSAGKSSLTIAGCLRGHPYLADDVVAVDRARNIRPYHRPVGLRPPVAARVGLEVPPGPPERSYPVPMSAHTSLSAGAPLGLVVFVRRHPDGTWCEPEAPSMTLMRLSGHAFGLDVVPRSVFRRLEAIARSVPAIALWHHDLDAAIDLVETEVDRLWNVSARADRTAR